jgi:hypothetical protein
MITGSRTVRQPLPVAVDRMKLLLVARWLRVTKVTEEAGRTTIHWTNRDSSTSGEVLFSEAAGAGTQVDYVVRRAQWATALYVVLAVLLSFTIVVPIFLVVVVWLFPRQAKQFMEELLNAV